MWNVTNYGNLNMNKFERLMSHKGHLERIACTRKMIDTKRPIIPSFLQSKFYKKRHQYEKNLIVDYQNKVIMDKMIYISKHRSPYSQQENIPKRCPAFEKTIYNKNKYQNFVDIENQKLKKRFMSARPHYKSKNLDTEYNDCTKKIEKNISENRNFRNPNINFATPAQFKKNLSHQIYIEREAV